MGGRNHQVDPLPKLVVRNYLARYFCVFIRINLLGLLIALALIRKPEAHTSNKPQTVKQSITCQEHRVPPPISSLAPAALKGEGLKIWE
jgi:hypothetical protein